MAVHTDQELRVLEVQASVAMEVYQFLHLLRVLRRERQALQVQEAVVVAVVVTLAPVEQAVQASSSSK